MEAKVLDIKIERPEVTIHQRNWQEVRKYLKQGFYIFEKKNGMTILRKKSKIIIQFETPDGKVEVVNMKHTLKKWYGKDWSSEKIFNHLEQDLREERITFNKDSDGQYFIVEV